MFYRPWQTVRPDPARSAALSAALGMPRLVCDVMCARGLDTPEAARAVCGGGDALSDPMLLSRHGGGRGTHPPRHRRRRAPSPYSGITMWTA